MVIGDVTISDFAGSVIASVACTSTSIPPFQPIWLDIYGAVVSSDISANPFSRSFAVNTSDGVTGLFIRDFRDSTDAGVYTCLGQGPDSAQTIVIGDITLGPQVNLTDPSKQPQGEIVIGDVTILDFAGSVIASVGCTSSSTPPFQPIWLDIYGAVVPSGVSGNPFGRHFAVNTSDSVTGLFIRDFKDSTDAGVYTCLGQGPDSAQTIVIGDITLGPQVNLSDPSKQPQDEIVIGDLTTLDIGGSVYASVACTSTSIPPFQPIWLDIYGAVVSSDVSANPFGRHFAVNTSDSVTGLVIRDFKDSTDAGVYTCLGQGPDSAQTIVIGDITFGPQINTTEPIKQPQGEIVIGEVTTMNIAGFMITSVGCTSTSIPPFQPIWLDIYGAVVPRDISANPFSRHFAVNTSDSVTGLIIRDFKDSTDAGVYTCLGQGPDSAQTVVIGDITLGPQVNLTDPSKQPHEIEISEVVTLDIIGSIYASVACISKSSPPFQPIWLDLYGAVVPITEDIPTNPSSRILAVRSTDGVTGLVIRDFKDSTDAGVYTCLGQDPDSAQTIVIGDITQGPLANPTTLPSVAEPSEQPNEIVIGEVSTINVVGSVYASVSCTSQSSPPFQPIWLDLYGAVVPRDIVRNPFSRHFGVNTSDSVTELVIKDFEDSTDAGVYTCLGQGPDSAQTIVIGNITQGPLANPSEQPRPCEEIRIPACSVGIGYSSTYVPSLVGLGQNELGDVFRGLEPVFANPCSPYFRPYMCALYLPPCRERAVLPCKELCLTAVDQCAETLRITFSVEELAGMRESCASMPSENEPGAKCHNVKEVEIGAVAGARTRRVTVECTYNLLPPVQPRWFSPSGREILSGSWRRVRVIESSDSITVLEIKNYAPHIDEGSYTCAGPIQRVTVDL